MKCETCKKEVSKFAKVCEHCGSPIKIEGTENSTYYYKVATENKGNEKSDQESVAQWNKGLEGEQGNFDNRKKRKDKNAKNYKTKIACVSLAIVMLLSIIGVRYVLTRSVDFGNTPIVYTAGNQLICYDEKTKREKVLARGSFDNLLLKDVNYSDEKEKMDKLYYITEDGKQMVYRGNDTVSESNMGNGNSTSYDLYQVQLTSKATPVLIASNVAEHSVLADKYVVYSCKNAFGEVYLYNLETKQETPYKLRDSRLSLDGKYALEYGTGDSGMVVYSFPEMEEVIDLSEWFVKYKVNSDFSKLIYLNRHFELCLVTNLEHKEVIAEKVLDFTVDFSKEEMEVYYQVIGESKTTVYDYIVDSYYEQDLKLSKPVLKDGQLEDDPTYVSAMEAYEEKIKRDILRTELKDMEFYPVTGSLYRYQQGEHKKLIENIFSIGNDNGISIYGSSFIPYCTEAINLKMEIDWSESEGVIYNQLVEYYQSEYSQRNVYLFGEEGLIDLGEYEVVSIDSEDKKLSLASYAYNGDTQTVEKIKLVSYKEDSFGEELIAKDMVPFDHTVDYVKVNGLMLRSNLYASGIYYDVDDTKTILDGYIPESCKMASEDETIYYLAEGREGKALYQIDKEKEEPVFIAEEVVAFYPNSKNDVIVLCKKEGSEEGTLYRFKGPLDKQEIANNVTTFPGYMWE